MTVSVWVSSLWHHSGVCQPKPVFSNLWVRLNYPPESYSYLLFINKKTLPIVFIIALVFILFYFYFCSGFLLPFFYYIVIFFTIIVYCFIELSFSHLFLIWFWFWSVTDLIYKIFNIQYIQRSATSLKSMTDENNNIDHLVKMPRSAGKPWVPAFTWPLWEASLTQTPLQTKWAAHGKDTAQWQRPPSRTTQLQHCKNCSGTTQRTWQRPQSVNLGSEFLRSQSNWASIGCTMSQERSMGAPTWMVIGSGTSHRCSTDLESEEFKGQFRFIGPFLNCFYSVAGALFCRGALPSRSAVAMRGGTWSATIFVWMILVKEVPAQMPGLKRFQLNIWL